VNVWLVLLDAVTQLAPLFCDTSYLVIGLPPVPEFKGDNQVSVTFPFPGVAAKFRGAFGVVMGVPDILADAPMPALFTACTIKV